MTPLECLCGISTAPSISKLTTLAHQAGGADDLASFIVEREKARKGAREGIQQYETAASRASAPDKTTNWTVGNLCMLARPKRVNKLAGRLRGPLLVAAAGPDPNTWSLEDLVTRSRLIVHANRMHSAPSMSLRRAEVLAAVDHETYEVEAIRAHRLTASGAEILIHWAGYEDAEDTWEDLLPNIELEALDAYLGTLEPVDRAILERAVPSLVGVV